jgi:membrane AbrB-like protein
MTIAIGACGGAVFAYFKMPLAWMLGSITATMPLAMLGVDLRMDSRLRMGMIVILGVMIGGQFSPSIVASAGRWWVSIACMSLFAAVLSAIIYLYFRLVVRLDRGTALFSCLPGGLNEMAILGRDMGADDRLISVIHSVRIFVVVMTVPFLFQALGWYERGASTSTVVALGDVNILEMIKIAGGTCAGIFLCRFLKFPSPILIGTMVGSASVYVAGYATGQLPTIFIILAQVIIGSAIGARFAGLRGHVVWRISRHAMISTAIMLAATFLVVGGMTWLTDFEVQPLLLAFAPGGFAEMSLIALALNVDTAYVATHHIARIFLIVLIAPAVARGLDRAGFLTSKPANRGTEDGPDR